MWFLISQAVADICVGTVTHPDANCTDTATTVGTALQAVGDNGMDTIWVGPNSGATTGRTDINNSRTVVIRGGTLGGAVPQFRNIRVQSNSDATLLDLNLVVPNNQIGLETRGSATVVAERINITRSGVNTTNKSALRAHEGSSLTLRDSIIDEWTMSNGNGGAHFLLQGDSVGLLERVRLFGGEGDDLGGSIQSDGTLTLRQVYIEGSTTRDGDGATVLAATETGSVTLEDVLIVNNGATTPTGNQRTVRVAGSQVLMVTGLRSCENRAVRGGAIEFDGSWTGSGTVTRSLFMDNSATSNGGGIRQSSGRPFDITRSTFVRNSTPSTSANAGHAVSAFSGNSISTVASSVFLQHPPNGTTIDDFATTTSVFDISPPPSNDLFAWPVDATTCTFAAVTPVCDDILGPTDLGATDCVDDDEDDDGLVNDLEVSLGLHLSPPDPLDFDQDGLSDVDECPPLAGTDPILNGSFERFETASEIRLNGISFLRPEEIPPWSTASDDDIELFTDTGPWSISDTPDGQFSTELNRGSATALEQTLTMTPGETVDFRFQHRASSPTGTNTLRLTLDVGGVFSSQDFSVDQGEGWKQQTASLTIPGMGGATEGTLRLEAIAPTGNSGNAIDALFFGNFADADGDGLPACRDPDRDGDGVDDNVDCAPDDPLRSSLSPEYVDADADTYFAPSGTMVCGTSTPPAEIDCDDNNPLANQGMVESCDTPFDDDCDGLENDDDDVDASTPGVLTVFADPDMDGWGSGPEAFVCVAPADTATQTGDCAPANPAISPDATESCATQEDDNCDGFANDDDDLDMDTPGALLRYTNEDGDDYGVDPIYVCDTTLNGVAEFAGDCDDTNPAIFPAAQEFCDGLDNDCDLFADDDDPDTFAADGVPMYIDADGDGFGEGTVQDRECSGILAGHAPNNTDCDDTLPDVFPGADEVCDSVDNDCDGQADDDDPEGPIDAMFWVDDDGDGFGAEGTPTCIEPPSSATQAGDCDDTRFEVNTGASERCDGLDTNCDELIDNDASDQLWYPDGDDDGFGDDDVPGISSPDCNPPQDGFVQDNTDCADDDTAENPGADELCDQLDNDCDGLVDDDDVNDVITMDTPNALTRFLDSDGDNFGSTTEVFTCTDTVPFTSDNNLDCNDDNITTFPGAPEFCDGLDNDCDLFADDDDPDTFPLDGQLFYEDSDGDGFGNESSSDRFCELPEQGWTDDFTDCNDDDALSNPMAPEVCDGIDTDCDNLSDDEDPDIVDRPTWYADEDGDGFGAGQGRESCDGEGRVNNDADCNDEDLAINPDATEVCDGADNDCDDDVDEDCDDAPDTTELVDAGCGCRQGPTPGWLGVLPIGLLALLRRRRA